MTLAVQQMHADGKTVYGKLCLVSGERTAGRSLLCLTTRRRRASCALSSWMLCMALQVDLAGSERSDKTVAKGQTLEEGKLINKSLRWAITRQRG